MIKKQITYRFFVICIPVFLFSCKKEPHLDLDKIAGTYKYHENGGVSLTGTTVKKIEGERDEMLLDIQEFHYFKIKLTPIDDHIVEFVSGDSVFPVTYTTGQGCVGCSPGHALRKMKVSGKFFTYNKWIEMTTTIHHKEINGDWVLWDEQFVKMHQ